MVKKKRYKNVYVETDYDINPPSFGIILSLILSFAYIIMDLNFLEYAGITFLTFVIFIGIDLILQYITTKKRYVRIKQ